MSKSLRAMAAMVVALSFAILAASPAAAVSGVKQTGMVGHWSFAESSTAPLVTCKYGPEVAPDYSYMRSVKVQPPTVFAADRNSAKVDHRRVTWQFQLQHTTIPTTGAWQTVASSATQHATAYDNKAATFTPMTVDYKGRSDGADNDYAIRVKVTIKWLKPSGGVDGTITFFASYYKIVSGVGDFVSGEPWCSELVTAG